MAKQTPSIDSLKKFVRREASHFLRQPNVTSVGVGYKRKDGKDTRQLSIVFTVGNKVRPESLETIGAVPLPESVMIDGIKVPTDVIQRDYETSNRKIRPQSLADRKKVVDPVVPGVSIGHVRTSAGTAGAVVYDASNGAPYILSNWHVLHTPLGEIGDDIVQPGPHDDNRVSRNIVGKLARSHLGVAGDCAITTIEHRQLSPLFYELGTALTKIAEPQLDDLVIKSGRTTGVTRGIVQRLHVVARINYDEAGDQEIGCIEIGPDRNHPTSEISMGGDSGSAWMEVKNNKPTGVMLGLHFAGETQGPDHALACYPASVFEKLGILPQPPAVPVIEAAGLGYATNFIGAPVPMPAPANVDIRNDLLVVSGRTVFDYTHFSLAMSKSRRFARWVAWNIDGGALKKVNRNGIPFKKDPNLPAKAQVGNELYVNNPLDRGHVARRADLVWGPIAEARKANIDSFYYTNMVPQHEAFNQSQAQGIWGELENAIFADIEVAEMKISVMGGPIYSSNDPVYRDVQLPRKFWKVIYFRQEGSASVQAKGYVLSQEDLLTDLEVLELPDFAVFEVAMPRLSEMINLKLYSGDASGSGIESLSRARVTVGTPVRRVWSVKEIVG